MISKKDRERILDAARIEDVVGEFLQLKDKGRHLTCCCPVHNEKTPSFTVSPALNTYHCFGCGIGGNAISFLTDVQHMSYPEAIKWLASRYNITVEENERELTADERNEQIRKEAMMAANKYAAQFFTERIKDSSNERAVFALNYAIGRWGKKFVDQEGIGFAPGRGAFIAWAKEKGLTEEILMETGLVREKDGRRYDGFYDRITIPIKDRFGNVIGFTARALTGNGPKYINSPESPVYHKRASIFGIHNALRTAAKEEKFYLVEGGPDVLKLQSIGILNTIAALGSKWTDEHFKFLKRYNPTLCFIPDSDKIPAGKQFGVGIESVMESGTRALTEGFNVSVKEIPMDSDGEKADPDNYFSTRQEFNEIQEEDFVIWYAKKKSMGIETTTDKAEAVKDVAKILARIKDKLQLKMYLKQLSKLFGIATELIKKAIGDAVADNLKKKQKTGAKLIDQELYQKYGFFERGNCYFALNSDGIEQSWSNFTMEPLFHIKDSLNPKRLFRIKNANGHQEIIELKQEDLCSVTKFKVRVSGLGNYVWKAKDEQLTKLTVYLYDMTETAIEITQLGWQQDGFFAFGNGVFHNGQWMPADEFGIVRIEGVGNYYIPAASGIYKKDRRLFQFERRFIHTNLSNISLRQYTDKMAEVFGDNAKVGFCFFIASLFKDVVTGVTKNFPMLNLFGPKGSGKSELGHSLMSFFIIKNDPPNLSTATDAGLADTVAQCANALVHIDEYKNDILLGRREFIKGLYDGVGRTRMNMDRDKKRETTSVDCGVIISGQEMPTIDIAIFSRMIYLTFTKTEFGAEAGHRFDELKEMRDRGCSHLVLQLLRHRKKFEMEFGSCYKTALADINNAINESVEDRILRNWVTILAAFRTLEGVMDVAFTYAEMLKICVAGISRQNAECSSSNELAGFWQMVDFLHQNGEIFIDADYRIKYESFFKGKGQKAKTEFQAAKPILYLCTKRVLMLYSKNGKAVGDKTLPRESLRFYLENSKEFIGIKQAVRFKNFVNEAESSMTMKNPSGTATRAETSRVDWALCFDYEKLVEKYQINLEVEVLPADEIDTLDVDTSDESLPY